MNATTTTATSTVCICKPTFMECHQKMHRRRFNFLSLKAARRRVSRRLASLLSTSQGAGPISSRTLLKRISQKDVF